ncbi:hypothetical protein [Methylacidimicrobium sp. B4]|uniref:hypothetical protein n=1 Tax=Methylacidimicrobium sp. B4 TaxID=2796139 RepID=UPI001A8DC6AD|nr:hypothetical protein [Methylacidimicrobium sp. B4]QSR84157.1 hypothetical protein MacB4_07875 [Methylacidimicrobium sp. B4]
MRHQTTLNPHNFQIAFGGEYHSYGDQRPLKDHCFQLLKNPEFLEQLRKRGFRDLALEFPEDIQRDVDHFLGQAEARWGSCLRKIHEKGLVGGARDKAVAEAADQIWQLGERMWRNVAQKAGPASLLDDNLHSREWCAVLSEVAYKNAQHPEARMRVHCIDVPSERYRKAYRDGDVCLVMGVPRSCQGVIDDYLARGEALAKVGKTLSARDAKWFGEAIAHKLQEGNPKWQPSNDFWEQMEGMTSVINAERRWAGGKITIRTSGVDDTQFWNKVRERLGERASELVPPLGDGLTPKNIRERNEYMASKLQAIGQSVVSKEGSCGIFAWNGDAHVHPELPNGTLPRFFQNIARRQIIVASIDENGEPVSAADGSQLWQIYSEVGGKLVSDGKEHETKKAGKAFFEARPPQKDPPGMPDSPQRQPSASLEKASNQKVAKSGPLTHEAWIAVMREKIAIARENWARNGGLDALRQRRAEERPIDLSKNPFGTLRSLASAEIAKAVARLQELPKEPPARKEVASSPPMARERKAQLLALLVQGQEIHAQRQAETFGQMWEKIHARQSSLGRQPFDPHSPPPLSTEGLQKIEFTRTDPRVERSRQADRGGRA